MTTNVARPARAVLVVALTALALLALLAAGSPVAVAQAPGAAPQAPPPPPGGWCTSAPDTRNGIDLSDICQEHDACYESSTSRRACDDAMRNDFHAACTEQYRWLDARPNHGNGKGDEAARGDRRLCHGWADEYHFWIRRYGGEYYVGTGDRA